VIITAEGAGIVNMEEVRAGVLKTSTQIYYH